MVEWEPWDWKGRRRAGVTTYEFCLLPVRIEQWCQGQGFLLPRCPSGKAQRGSRWAKVLAVLVRTSEDYEWVAVKWWETITMIAPSRRT